MTTDKGRPLPKFGDWDVKNPASAEGFTVIFQKARDDKKTTGPGHAQAGIPPAFRNNGDGGYRPDFKTGADTYPYTPPKRAKVVVLYLLIAVAGESENKTWIVPHQK